MQSKIKKLIPYVFILIMVIGFFSATLFTKNVSAQTSTPPTTTAPTGTCDWQPTGRGDNVPPPEHRDNVTYEQCKSLGGNNAQFVAKGSDKVQVVGHDTPDTRSEFESQVLQRYCGITHLDACLVVLAYFILYQLPAWLLLISAKFFNAIIAISLSSTLTSGSSFISTAWAVVRDLSNIFFIIVLLYVAIQTILGIGGGGHGGGPKKMIAQVVIMALLINFSMFFTQVVIDSSNILALVFYSKLTTNTTVGTAKKTKNYTPSNTTNGEKDLAGAMVNSFNPTSALTWNTFFKQSRSTVVNGVSKVTLDDTPTGITLGLIVVAGAIMLFAAYAFFISGLSFLGRLLELWIIIIFSPFAFMSSTLPVLEHIPDVGWDAWLKKLFQVAFMAPIFMFFMYFIFMLIQANLFSGLIDQEGDLLATLLRVIIPALMLMTLLMKATSYAKKGSGQFGEIIVKGGQMAAGLAGGLALGGAGMALRGGFGRLGEKISNSATLKNAESEGGVKGFAAARFRDLGKFAGRSSFDLRGVKVGGMNLASVTGMDVGEAKKGGFALARKEQIAKRQQRAEELKVTANEDEAKAVRAAGIKLHEVQLQDIPQTNDKGDIIDNTGFAIEGAKTYKDGQYKDENGNVINHDVPPRMISRQDKLIRLNNGRTDSEAAAALKALKEANEKLERATEALRVDPADPNAIREKDEAEKEVNIAKNAELATRSLGKLQRAQSEQNDKLVKAERAVKDAEADVQRASTPEEKAAANRILGEMRTARDQQIKTTDEARQRVLDREASIRATAGPMSDAEDVLKEAQNALNAVNRDRGHSYAHSLTHSPVSQALNFITSGGEFSFSADEEAHDNILLGAKVEKVDRGGRMGGGLSGGGGHSGGGHGSEAVNASTGSSGHGGGHGDSHGGGGH